MADVLVSRGNLHTDVHRGKISCENKSRDWGNVSTSKGRPKIASKPSGEARTDFPSQASERGNQADTLILDI